MSSWRSFLQQCMDVMDEVSMVQICKSSFTQDDIAEAKKIPFASVNRTDRMVSHRREGTPKSLQEKITLLKEIDPDDVPTFVVRDLRKVPPITFENTDVISLLKDITSLKAGLAEMVLKFEASQKTIAELRGEVYDQMGHSTASTETEPKPPDPPQKPPDITKSEENIPENPSFTQKPLLNQPKISPSSIPNPSVATKPHEAPYPNYSYLYSVPRYSAFQPVAQPNTVNPNITPTSQVGSVSTKNHIDIYPVIKLQSTDTKVQVDKAVETKNNTLTIPETISHQASENTTSKPLDPIKDHEKNDAITPKTMTPTVIESKPVFEQHKKPVPFNPAFHIPKSEATKVEIQSNILVKNVEENSEQNKTPVSNSISTLLSAAEAIRKTEAMNEIETAKTNYSQVIPEAEKKNKILLIQSKPKNPKMLLTIQQPNPVLLQRNNFESKNLQAPSRPSNQKETDKVSSKVVALKRLHQENCDENDFENLITENQIYGNKIVVKEKSHGTQLEQDLKKNRKDKKNTEPKNVVLQPNILYLGNVQIPNLMMIKNKITSNIIESNRNKNDKITELKTKNVVVSKEFQILKPNNLIHVSNDHSKTDYVLQTNQKLVMTPQIVYQVPMLVETDPQKLSNQKVHQDYLKSHNRNSNDKVYIACPYQMDTKIQPKIVITNIRPQLPPNDEEISTLDIYERREKLRKLKYTSIRENKRSDKPERDIITPDLLKDEVFRELSNLTYQNDDSSSIDDDYKDESIEYKEIIETYSGNKEKVIRQKIDFLAHFDLGTHGVCNEKNIEKELRSMSRDPILSAYVRSGLMDRLTKHKTMPSKNIVHPHEDMNSMYFEETTDSSILKMKQGFMRKLNLQRVSKKYREEYELVWQNIMKERKRRNCKTKLHRPENKLDLNTKDQLKLLSQIQHCVNENNNLIKKRLDCNSEIDNDIPTLAEKNISQVNKLSKMADNCVRILSGRGKRDLTPGFDSENIEKYTLNIPDVSKIYSVPQSYDEVIEETLDDKKGEIINERTQNTELWDGITDFISTYKQYELDCAKEKAELQRRNASIRASGMSAIRTANRDSELARGLAEQSQMLLNQEFAIRNSLNSIMKAIDSIRNYE